MATTEERLAALEAKLAQLTATTPTEYYTHQYSGEEIDAAVGIALTGGALDTSATNVSKQLGTFVRPNLLDNWYFGRPVDQRKGKIIQSGVNIYTDNTLKTLIGPAAYACPVVELTSTYAKVQDAKNTSSYYYAAPADVVRGYTGAFVYTIDRWQLGNGSISLSVAADGIALNGGNNASTDYIYTRVERLPVVKYTFSVLFADNTANVVLTTRLTDISVVPAVESREASGVLALTWDQPEEFTADYAYFRIHIPGSAKILAAKLELGPTQTLAHREGDRWVLNEVPEYGEQLRRCQRYFESTAWAVCLAVATATTTIEFCGSYYFKIEKRVPPVITVSTPSQAATIYDTVANVYYTDVEVQQPTAYNTKMMAPKIYDSKGRFVIGRIYQVIVGDGQYLVSADL